MSEIVDVEKAKTVLNNGMEEAKALTKLMEMAYAGKQ